MAWNADSLYNSAVAAIVINYNDYFRQNLRTYPENIIFDVYYKLYKEGKLCGIEFRDLTIFERLLKVTDKTQLLHTCFQALMDKDERISRHLAQTYVKRCTAEGLEDSIYLGLSLGSFLSEAGWYSDADKVMVACLELCKQFGHLVLECYLKLLNVRIAYCNFTDAKATFSEIEIVKGTNLAGLYGEFSALFFSHSHYKEAYKWSLEALKRLNSHLSPKIIVDVLRHASRVCVVKREFKRAELLIKQALRISKEHFGSKHLKTADTLMDYGFYLLNVDSVKQSVIMYKLALDIRLHIFGGHNFHVAIAHEDLAYALYVREYGSGKFTDAKDHAEKANEILNRLLPPNHLLLASSKRVKALILEEIAIDNGNENLFLEIEELHLSALQLAQQTFGEMNLQTAKHYGNLGRLYQSMKRYEDSERMHLNAIRIKEHILGPEDYEVALSIGHLASIYNYDMALYDKAERLYLKSIKIGLKLFGETYSGLEYDYRGLLNIYLHRKNLEKFSQYYFILSQWKMLRDHMPEMSLFETEPIITPEQIYPIFLKNSGYNQYIELIE